MRKAHIVTICAAVLVAACYALASAVKIDPFFGGVDLGRHVKNGELLLSSSAPPGTASRILHKNFYSYAAGDTEFINHHWLSGVVYFLVWKRCGFAGVNAFYVLLGTVAFLLSWRIAERAAGWMIATAVALAMMPILAVRANVRPEIFTLLFCGLFLTLLWKHYNGEVGWKALLALPLIEILWVNLHIGFIFGPVFIGAFMLNDLAARPPAGEDLGPNPWASPFYTQKLDLLKKWLLILLLTVAATLLNPNGIRGAIFPLAIWRNYGIDITENHSILYLESNGYTGEYLLIKLTVLALYVSFLAAIVRARRFPLSMLMLGVLLGCMGFFAIRNQTVMAMFALAAIGANLGLCGAKEFCDRHRLWAGLALGAIILAGLGFNGWKAYKRKATIGLGMVDGATKAAEFLRTSRLPGPMLNNLNIGGYLTFYLYPQYRIYTDSRPEAFSAEFLRSRYIEPLTDEDKWPGLLWEYQFNLICFSYASKWERDFLLRRVHDPNWAIVYSQSPVAILARRSIENQSLIRAYEIPRERLMQQKPPPEPGKK